MLLSSRCCAQARLLPFSRLASTGGGGRWRAANWGSDFVGREPVTAAPEEPAEPGVLSRAGRRLSALLMLHPPGKYDVELPMASGAAAPTTAAVAAPVAAAATASGAPATAATLLATMASAPSAPATERMQADAPPPPQSVLAPASLPEVRAWEDATTAAAEVMDQAVAQAAEQAVEQAVEQPMAAERCDARQAVAEAPVQEVTDAVVAPAPTVAAQAPVPAAAAVVEEEEAMAVPALAVPRLLRCERSAAQLTVAELRAALAERGAPAAGAKKKLQAALAEVAAPGEVFVCRRAPPSLTVAELRAVLAEEGVAIKGLKKKGLVALLL